MAVPESEDSWRVAGKTDTETSRQVLALKGRALTEWGKRLTVLESHGGRHGCGAGGELHTPSPCLTRVLLQVNVKRPMKDETNFEVVESGRYVILLLGKALSVVWDHHLGLSVVLKQTYQVSGPLPRLVCDLSL